MAAGRPTKYRPEFVATARKLSELGATDIEIADALSINIVTLYRWKASFPEFCKSIQTAKEVADERVERSLYARATGYSHPDTDIRVVDGQIVQTEIRKHYPPDTAAAFIWLKNRRGDRWRDKTVTEHTGEGGGPIRVYEVPM